MEISFFFKNKKFYIFLVYFFLCFLIFYDLYFNRVTYSYPILIKTNQTLKEISEFLFNKENEYEIILKNGKTKILLGSDGIFTKLDHLKAFQSALPDDKNFNIYKYIDLRYKNQIIVRERI